MNTPPDKIQLLTLSIGLSILVHLLVVFSLDRFGNYNFTKPVAPFQAVVVDLIKPSIVAVTATESDEQRTNYTENVAEDINADRNQILVQGDRVSTTATATTATEKNLTEPKPVEPVVINSKKVELIKTTQLSTIPPLRAASEFLMSKNEKLTYLISLVGVPVGSMELEAKNKDGEVFITLRTKSNAAMSNIYVIFQNHSPT